jgi:TolB-like protein/Tfp pilus assembly protein PilF
VVRSIAVLPLVNLTGDEAQQYLVDGVHEALIAELGRVEELSVISRTSVLPYRDSRAGATAIARALGVDALVEGSVFREADSLRITVQLVRGLPEERLWGSSFDGSVRRTLELQRRVARGITDAVRIRVSEDERVPLDQPEIGELAEDEYLRGRAQWRARSGPDLARAVDHLERAVELAPEFALAWAALADAYMVARGYGAIDMPWNEAYDRAEAAARTALELDPTLGEAHASLGFIRFQADWDVEAAERGLRLGLDLNPSYAQGHAWLSSVLRARGAGKEAVSEARKARQLDPFSAVMNRYLAFALAKTGHCDEAERHAATAVELDPHHADGYWIRWTCDVLAARPDSAVANALRAYRGWGLPAEDLEALRRAYASGGWDAALEQELTLLARPSIPVRTEYARAQRQALLGRSGPAFALLEAALERRDPLLLFELRTDPLIASLRDAPRYAALMERVGVAD